MGISTLCLLIFAESIALTNAVTFWNQYNSWSTRHQQETAFESPFSKAARQAQECAADSESCPQGKAPSAPPARLFPRGKIRLQSAFKKGGEYCRTCTKRCQTDDPEMLDLLSVRGGDASTPIIEAVTAAAGANPTLTTPYGIPLNGWKVIFQIFLTMMNVACWLIPLKSKKMTENKLALGLANAFSGGVFLSLAFGHLLPECTHGFEGMNEATPYMLALGGYMLIFFVEKIAFDTEHILDEAQNANAKAIGSKENGNAPAASSLSNSRAGAGRGAVILLGALAVHSILEMMALGLADTFGDSALLSLSIALHQPAESIALLVAFIKSGLPEADIIKYLSIFSAMGPIGVALGMAVNEFAAPIVDAAMLAIVAGTFIYVGATEVIPEEFEEPDDKWKKFLALVSGIVSIFVITQYTMTLEGLH